ncbi:MAG: sigma 54-interacting transcriptional regulator [Deltaproteobacteria bacterium]|nr:sigma 54-interacting transcriptional regulator [Deltaproteobacteria bacterium]
MIRVEVKVGLDAGRVLELKDDEVKIGRSPTNQIVVSDLHVSGEHAMITAAGSDRFLFRDLGSTNGSRVRRNGTLVPIDDPTQEVEMQTGDEVLLGDVEQPVVLAVTFEDDPDDARLLTVKPVKEIVEGEPKIAEDKASLRALYDAQKKIGAAFELNEVVDAVCAAVLDLLPRATHVTVVLREDDDDPSRKHPRYVPVATRARSGTPAGEPIPIARSVFRKVVASRSAVLAADARRDVGETASIMGAGILSTIGVPLWKGEEILGVLQVDNRASAGIFREKDLELITLLAAFASLATANASLHRRLVAAEERLRKENQYLKGREQRRRFEQIIGDSPAMRSVFEQLAKVVDTRVTVLIEGETGTGKELIASAVHYQSRRRDKLFVAQNCAALPENLLESELFGHKKGSFTGATEDKKGLFELADGGTLFLDEVTEMPLGLQAKLLRALQEGEVRPVGANVARKVDVRIVAATNRDLEAEVGAGRFRQDLYYRLKVFPLRLPPLRERREDIPLLAGHFLTKYSAEFAKPVGGFSQQAMELLQGFRWPGNVRELENEVQRLVIQLESNGFVMPEHLSPRIRQVENLLDRIHPTKGTLKEMVEQVEKWILREALREHNNNKSATAKTLGITREGLHKKLKAYGIS